MKITAIIILILISVSSIGQNLAKCGVDNDPKLTQTESEFLNEYISEYNKPNFDFTNKKVIFVTGNSGNKFGTKSEYFDRIKERNKNGGKNRYVDCKINPRRKSTNRL